MSQGPPAPLESPLPRHPRHAAPLGVGESATEAVVALLATVLFGLVWAHVELGRGSDALPGTGYAAAFTSPAPIGPAGPEPFEGASR